METMGAANRCILQEIEPLEAAADPAGSVILITTWIDGDLVNEAFVPAVAVFPCPDALVADLLVADPFADGNFADDHVIAFLVWSIMRWAHLVS